MLPQKIDQNIEGDVKLFFRVGGTFKNCTVKVECGGKTIIERKKRIVAPGEMETLLLKFEEIKKAQGPITVFLEVGE